MEVPLEVLARAETHALGGRTEEVRLGGVAQSHTTEEPVEGLEAAGDPGETLLCEHDLQVRMTLQHSPEDQVPDRPVREPGNLDQHDGPGHLVVAVVGYAAST